MSSGPQPAVEGAGDGAAGASPSTGSPRAPTGGNDPGGNGPLSNGPLSNGPTGNGPTGNGPGIGNGSPARTVEPRRPLDGGRVAESGNGGGRPGAGYALPIEAALRARLEATNGMPPNRLAPGGGVGPPPGGVMAYSGGPQMVPTAQMPVGTGRHPGPPPDRVRQDRDLRPRVVQGRRTRRVVRKIDTWTVLKMSLLFYLCVFLVFMIAGVVLWNIGVYFNVIVSVQKFIKSLFELQSFKFNPSVMLQGSAIGGLILVFLGTLANVLAALIYNLIADVVGGVQLIVLEEASPSE